MGSIPSGRNRFMDGCYVMLYVTDPHPHSSLIINQDISDALNVFRLYCKKAQPIMIV